MRNLDCRWITCDNSCHYSKCLLKMAYIDKLEEKFNELGLRSSYYAYQLPSGCDQTCDCGFVNARDEVTRKKDTDPEMDEQEATNTAKLQIASLSTDDLCKIYKKCAYKKIAVDLKAMKKDIEELQESLDELSDI